MAEQKMPSPNGDDIRPIAQGSRGKVSFNKKLKNIFISDSVDSVGGYLLHDVIIPSIKNMLLQGGHGLVDSFFGGRRSNNYGGYNNWNSGPSYSYGVYNQRTNYSGYSSNNNYQAQQANPSYFNPRRNDDCMRVYRSWMDADKVHDLLVEYIQRKRCVTIADWNYISKMPNKDYTDDNWGWYDVTKYNIYVIPHYYEDGSDGYALELPSPIYITNQK